MHKLRMLFILAGIVLLVMVATSGWFLVVDQPRKADVIMIIAGETDQRPARGLELLEQGYAPRMILDVPAGAKVYQWTQPELAQRYVESLPANDLPHLFERIWRKDPARSAAQHSGLGLALAKSCADALGMSLTAAMLDSHTLTVLLTCTHAGDNSSSESEAIANLSSVDGAATRG